AMHFLRACRSGSAFAYDSAAADQRGLAALPGLLLRLCNGAVHSRHIVAIYTTDDIPAIAFKTGGRIVAEPPIHLTVNRNTVVVVEDDELGQAKRARQRTHLVGYAFHKAAVAH